MLDLIYYSLGVVTLWARPSGIFEIRNKGGTKLVFHNFLQRWQWFGIMARI